MADKPRNPGGRPAGSREKNRQALKMLLQQQYPGYEPVIRMADAAMALSEQAETEGGERGMVGASAELLGQVVAAHDKVAAYLTPKLKSIEVSGADGGPFMVVQVAGDAEL